MEIDNVNHPAHYTMGKIETIEAISAALGDEGEALRNLVEKVDKKNGDRGRL